MLEKKGTTNHKPDKKLKILLAEDDVINQKLFSYMLKEVTVELLIAGTGAEALELYDKNEDIDLVLMDLKMPIMDGHEATRKLREQNKEVKIFALSAFSPETEGAAANQSGFSDYVAKPVKKEELLKAIDKHF